MDQTVDDQENCDETNLNVIDRQRWHQDAISKVKPTTPGTTTEKKKHDVPVSRDLTNERIQMMEEKQRQFNSTEKSLDTKKHVPPVSTNITEKARMIQVQQDKFNNLGKPSTTIIRDRPVSRTIADEKMERIRDQQERFNNLGKPSEKKMDAPVSRTIADEKMKTIREQQERFNNLGKPSENKIDAPVSRDIADEKMKTIREQQERFNNLGKPPEKKIDEPVSRTIADEKMKTIREQQERFNNLGKPSEKKTDAPVSRDIADEKMKTIREQQERFNNLGKPSEKKIDAPVSRTFIGEKMKKIREQQERFSNLGKPSEMHNDVQSSSDFVAERMKKIEGSQEKHATLGKIAPKPSDYTIRSLVPSPRLPDLETQLVSRIGDVQSKKSSSTLAEKPTAEEFAAKDPVDPKVSKASNDLQSSSESEVKCTKRTNEKQEKCSNLSSASEKYSAKDRPDAVNQSNSIHSVLGAPQDKMDSKSEKRIIETLQDQQRIQRAKLLLSRLQKKQKKTRRRKRLPSLPVRRTIIFFLVAPIFLSISLNRCMLPTSPLDYDNGSMFDLIAYRYDSTNRILSLNLDRSWRKMMIQRLLSYEYLFRSDDGTKKHTWNKHPVKVLDLATGTADIPIMLAKELSTMSSTSATTARSESHTQKVEIIGIDPSQNMIDIGNEKVQRENFTSTKISLELGDARELKLKANIFDVVTMSFGVRGIPEREDALCEIHRVLKKKGNSKLAVLEFSEPDEEAGMIGEAMRLFIRHLVPIIEVILSSGFTEYRHWQHSIQVEDFPSPREFVKLMEGLKCGRRKKGAFRVDEMIQMNFGSIQLYIATPQ